MSASIISPIHVAPLGCSTLRFFKSPATSPDLPWHVHTDLAACLDLPRPVRREFHRMLMNGPFKPDVRTVATDSGIVTIAPHFAAQGMIGASLEVGRVKPAFEMEYAKAVITALKVLSGDLPPRAALDFAIAAAAHSLRGDQ
jgi:hypothetical protein